MPRQARLDAPGTLHHVMVRGIERRRIVNDVADRKNFIKRLGELAAGMQGDVVSLLIYEFNIGIYSSCRAKPE